MHFGQRGHAFEASPKTQFLLHLASVSLPPLDAQGSWPTQGRTAAEQPQTQPNASLLQRQRVTAASRRRCCSLALLRVAPAPQWRRRQPPHEAFGSAASAPQHVTLSWGQMLVNMLIPISVGELACVWVTTFVVGTRSLLSDSRTGDAICHASVRARFVPCPGARIGTALVRSSCVTARDCRRGARRTVLASV